MENDEKVESSAEIISDIRERADTAERHGEHQTHNDGVAMLLRSIADRIEAAWKREHEELDKRISDLEAYAKLWTGRADELRLKCDEFYAKAKPVGNAAAMREALREAIGETCAGCKRDCDDCMNLKSGWMKKAKAALSAPARNCDKMPDIDNLTMHDLAKSPCKTTLKYASREELLALVRWLLAPAAERKGECDDA